MKTIVENEYAIAEANERAADHQNPDGSLRPRGLQLLGNTLMRTVEWVWVADQFIVETVSYNKRVPDPFQNLRSYLLSGTCPGEWLKRLSYVCALWEWTCGNEGQLFDGQTGRALATNRKDEVKALNKKRGQDVEIIRKELIRLIPKK